MLERGDHSMNAIFPAASQSSAQPQHYEELAMNDFSAEASRDFAQQLRCGDFNKGDFFPEDSQASATEDEDPSPLQSREESSNQARGKFTCTICPSSFKAR
jgi:hypothetical protein